MLFGIFKILLLILILSGNGLVVSVLIFKSDLKKSKNGFLLSLSLSGLAVGLFVIPNYAGLVLGPQDSWNGMCKVCLYLEYVATTGSVMTLSAMAADRFQLLVFPLKFRAYKYQFYIVSLVVAWIVSITYGFRGVVSFGALEVKSGSGNETSSLSLPCTTTGAFSKNKVYIITDFVILFFIPVLILAFSNIFISVMMACRKTVTNNSKVKSSRKAIRIMLMMIVVFVVLQLPVHVVRLKLMVNGGYFDNYFPYLQGAVFVSWANSFVNVYFYGLLNSDVRDIFKRISKHFGKRKWTGTVQPAGEMTSGFCLGP